MIDKLCVSCKYVVISPERGSVTCKRLKVEGGKHKRVSLFGTCGDFRQRAGGDNDE